MHEVVERIIKSAHVSLLSSSYSPSVTIILNRFKDKVEREALDTLYPDLNLHNVGEDEISEALIRSRSAHTHFGEPLFDAQNILFKGWLEHLKLLGKGSS